MKPESKILELTYSLDKADFLNHQLFTASHSKLIKQKRFRNRIIVPVICFAFVLIFFIKFKKIDFFLIIFLSIALFWLLFYPLRDKYVYINHYKKFIDENYEYKIDKINTLTIFSDPDFSFDLKDYKESFSVISSKDYIEVNELPTAFYLKLKTAQSIIIPKNKLENIEEIKCFLQNLAKENSINYNEFPNWKWK